MQLSTQVDGDRGVIRVSGEVDDVNAPTLSRAATEMLSDGVHNLVIDCRDIEFIDSSGLDVMVEAYKLAHAEGGTVTVRRPTAFTYRLLQVSGLDTVLLIEGSPEADPSTRTPG